MLQQMRKGAGSLIARMLLGLLVVSFGLWGISGIVPRLTREYLAYVGDTEISADRFRTEYERQRQELARTSRQAISPELARLFRLPQMVLGRLITEAALDENVRRFVLGVSDTEVARAIADDPSFSLGGRGFNPLYFQLALRQLGMSEQMYVVRRRQIMLQQEIGDAIVGGLVPPRAYDEIMFRFQNQKRTANYLILGAERFGKVDPPDDATLTSYYELVKGAFRTKELRKADILAVTIEQIVPTIEVSDADAQITYENQKVRFATPERRHILQMAFPDEASASAALEKLRNGTSFEALAEERLIRPADFDLGVLTKADVVDPTVADAAFALPVDGTSDVVKGRFGPVIVKITEIQPGSAKSFDEVKADIKREIAQSRAKGLITDLVNKIEDERAAGSRLSEIAAKLNLTLRHLDGVDRTGKDAADQDVADIPGGSEALDAIFSAQPGADTDPVRLRDGGSVFFDTTEVTSEHDRPLAEVRDRVIARWTEEQQRAALLTKANEIIGKLKDGATLDSVGTELGIEIRQTQPFTRTTALPDFTRATVDEAFRVQKGAGDSGLAENNKDRVVFVVTSVEDQPYAPSTDQTQTRQRIETLRDEIVAAYIESLKTELGTTVNESALNRIVQPSSN